MVDRLITRHRSAGRKFPVIHNVEDRIRSITGHWASLSGQNLGVFDHATGRLVFAETADRTIGPVMGNGDLQQFLDRLHPDDRERVAGIHVNFLDALETLAMSDPDRSSVLVLDHRLKTPGDGYMRVMRQMTAFEWYEGQPKVRATLHMARDVTGLKLLDASVRFKVIASRQFRERFAAKMKKQQNFGWAPSNREREIIALLAMGLSSPAIADTLCISHHTVNNHRRNMLRESKAGSTVQLIDLARTKGWLG